MMTSHRATVLSALAGAKERALEACGLAMETNAKPLCPVRTGNLRNSITHASDERTAIVGTNVEYAPYVELGTRRQKAQPYLVPAVKEHLEEYKKLLESYCQ
jgi:HK97 gp10 family phage protein